MGVLYGSGDPVSGPAAELAFNEVLTAGSDVFVLEMGWRELEPAPGVIGTAALEAILAILDSLNQSVYLSLSIVDTNTITVPMDLVDPNDPTSLANGASWDNPILVARLQPVIDAVVPLLGARGGFFLSFGNDIDIYFSARPSQLPAYLSLVSSARDRAQSIEPTLATGVSVTRNATQIPGFTAQVWPVCDAAAFSYFPVDSELNVLSPTVATNDIDSMLADAGTLPVILQRVGYPSGLESGATNGSSQAMQASFVRELDAAIRERPRVRAVSWYLLNDWSDTTIDAFMVYFGINSPEFREYLGSLGLVRVDGSTKEAFDDMLSMLLWCPADLDSNGVLEPADVLEMIGRVDAGGNSGDFNANGDADFLDSIEFLKIYDRSCP